MAGLREVASVFLKLGTTAFGGPAAHIAMMDEEVVRRRQWLKRETFLDYVGATNLIPGPNSTELALHIGHMRAGWTGLLVAGVCFIVPSALIVGLIAGMYVRFGSLPAALALMWAVKPVVIAIVVQALWRLGHSAIKNVGLAVLAVAAIGAAAAGVHELIVLAGAATVMAIASAHRSSSRQVSLWLGAAVSTLANSSAAAYTTAVASGVSLPGLFFVFAKAGAVLFGSGYVLLAFLRADLVDRLHWLTEAQLLDAIAVGQVTPGPVSTTATFVGYLLGGFTGATVATVGMFLPAFVFVAISGPLVPRIRRSPVAGAMLDGVNVASVALMAVVLVHLSLAAFVDWASVAIGVVSIMALTRGLNSAWLILAGAAVGWWMG